MPIAYLISDDVVDGGSDDIVTCVCGDEVGDWPIGGLWLLKGGSDIFCLQGFKIGLSFYKH